VEHNPPPLVAITGGIACGKSLVGEILRGEGVSVWEADEAAHRLMTPGGETYGRIVERFGTGMLKENGTIDRTRLAERVFARQDELKDLNALVHPAVLRDMRRWAGEESAEGRHAAVIVPLLFEVGESKGWSAVVCVASDATTVLKRLEERGLTSEQAKARLAAQWPLEEKIRLSDYVIHNQGTKEDLRSETLRVWRRIVNEENMYHA